MKSIVEEVKEKLENAKPAFEGSSLIEKYEKAIQEFEDLVTSGMVKKRGNQLMSPVDAHLHSNIGFYERED